MLELVAADLDLLAGEIGQSITRRPLAQHLSGAGAALARAAFAGEHVIAHRRALVRCQRAEPALEGLGQLEAIGSLALVAGFVPFDRHPAQYEREILPAIADEAGAGVVVRRRGLVSRSRGTRREQTDGQCSDQDTQQLLHGEAPLLRYARPAADDCKTLPDWQVVRPYVCATLRSPRHRSETDRSNRAARSADPAADCSPACPCAQK